MLLQVAPQLCQQVPAQLWGQVASQVPPQESGQVTAAVGGGHPQLWYAKVSQSLRSGFSRVGTQ